MSKITLNDLASLQNENTAITTINNNNSVIEEAFDNTLSRDGTSPNSMESDLDLNSNRIMNLPLALSDTEPVRKLEFDTMVFSGGRTSIEVGTTTTLGPLESATVTNVGTEYEAVLDFGIPKGLPGDVAGPNSAVDGHYAVFDGATGKLIKDGGPITATDAQLLFQTGDLKIRYGTGALTGYVRLNGLTIGNALSSATERANADTSALFQYLWNTDASLAVSGGRGANAAADFAANKNIALPDFRSRAPAGLSDMGNSNNALFSGVTFTSGDAVTLGSKLGAAKTSLITANLPSHNHEVFLNDPGHTHALRSDTAFISNLAGGSGNGYAAGQYSGPTIANTTGITVRDTTGGGGTANQTALTGSGTAFDTVSPYALVTIYIKL